VTALPLSSTPDASCSLINADTKFQNNNLILGRDLTINSDVIYNNGVNANILSLNSMKLQKSAGVKNTSITNYKGIIEADGSLEIWTNLLDNKRDGKEDSVDDILNTINHKTI